MHYLDWFRLRYELILDYPNRIFDIGSILEAFEFEGKITLDKDKSIYPSQFPNHFKKLRWHDHRTIEQLTSIRYMKVVSGSSYYVVGDIVEVLEIMYNNPTIVGGKNNILVNLKGHFFNITQLQPATKEDHDIFWKNQKHK